MAQIPLSKEDSVLPANFVVVVKCPPESKLRTIKYIKYTKKYI